MKLKREEKRRRIQYRIRKKVSGTAETPRLAIFRSNKNIYCQLINDEAGHTLCSASSREEGATSGTKVETAAAVGKLLAQRALALNVNAAVFDRSGYLYHGRVKALADGAREGGLKF